MTNRDSSFNLFNRYHKLLKIVNFYEHQIDVLDEMLDEFSAKYVKCALSTEKVQFHKAFAEKQKSIADLKAQIQNNNLMMANGMLHDANGVTDLLDDENVKLEKDVNEIELEVNELSREFKDYLIKRI